MSHDISITVPYNYEAVTAAAKMLQEVAKSFSSAAIEVVQDKKPITDADAQADLAGTPRVDNPTVVPAPERAAESLQPNKAVDDAQAIFKGPTPLAAEVADSSGVAPEHVHSDPIPLVTEVIPAPAPAVAALDASGLPWDERIHAKTKTQDVKGNWKYLRGVDKVTLVPTVEAELRVLVGTPAAEETPAPATYTATPAAPAETTIVAPPPKDIPAPDTGTPSLTVTTFAQLVTAITTNSIDEATVAAALDKVRIGNFALLGARHDLIPAVAGHLGL